MPIPPPQSGDDRISYMERCMEDATMQTEYPDRTQRFAVCLAQWQERRGKRERQALLQPTR
jgi:hypothetical protein